ncbi:hypothetical protein [Massilia sp. TN1-12]|uniref:hypothetical protein n=1 Tax=Massilia paldalensis TaxID=3377675 RepID=UPI003850BCDE
MTTPAPDGQKGRYKRDVVLVLIVSAIVIYFGIIVLGGGDRDGYFILAAGCVGLYYALYRVVKYIKVYKGWL